MEKPRRNDRPKLTPEELAERKRFIAERLEQRKKQLANVGFSEEVVNHMSNYATTHRGYEERHGGDTLIFILRRLTYACNDAHSLDKNDIEVLKNAVDSLVVTNFFDITEENTEVRLPRTVMEQLTQPSKFVLKRVVDCCRNTAQCRFAMEGIKELFDNFSDALDFMIHEFSQEREDARQERIRQARIAKGLPAEEERPARQEHRSRTSYPRTTEQRPSIQDGHEPAPERPVEERRPKSARFDVPKDKDGKPVYSKYAAKKMQQRRNGHADKPRPGLGNSAFDNLTWDPANGAHLKES